MFFNNCSYGASFDMYCVICITIVGISANNICCDVSLVNDSSFGSGISLADAVTSDSAFKGTSCPLDIFRPLGDDGVCCGCADGLSFFTRFSGSSPLPPPTPAAGTP